MGVECSDDRRAKLRRIVSMLRRAGKPERVGMWAYVATKKDGERIEITVTAKGYLNAAEKVTEILERRGIYPEHIKREELKPEEGGAHD